MQQGAADEQSNEILFDNNLNNLIKADGEDINIGTTEF